MSEPSGADARRAAVVFNPTKVGRADLARVVAHAEAASGWGPSLWLETSTEDSGADLARRAVEEGCALVLAVGGDGTIRAVAEGLRGTGVALGLCPRGTGNLLARNLRLQLGDLQGAVTSAFQGVPRPVDVGVVDWVRPGGEHEVRVFVVMAGMGLDAQIMSSTDEKLKKRVGMLAYVRVGLQKLRRDHRMRLQYRLDDQPPQRARVHTVLVGNCGSIGGNVTLMPDAAVDDGALDVLAMEPQGMFGWVRVAWGVVVDNGILRGRRNRAGGQGELRYQQCHSLEVWLREPESIQLDGDYFGKVVSLSVQVEPKALRVMMPPGWEPADPAA